MAGLIINNLLTETEANYVINVRQSHRRLGGIGRDDDFYFALSCRLKSSHLFLERHIRVDGQAREDDTRFIDGFNEVTQGFNIIHTRDEYQDGRPIARSDRQCDLFCKVEKLIHVTSGRCRLAFPGLTLVKDLHRSLGVLLRQL